jgi:hypothetical protein
MAKRAQSKIIEVNRLPSELITEMYHLFEKYYIDISQEQFRSDLFEKTHVFLFYHQKKLVGFSTIFRKAIPTIAPGLFLFSGDTVLHEDYWGSKILQTTFFRYIVESKLLSPVHPVHWLLISKGFKTFLMMRRNFLFSFPQAKRGTPLRAQDTMDKFYTWKFGDSYNPMSGLITFENPKGAVKGQIAAPTAEQTHHKEVAFFLEKNPDYQKGTELACYAEIRFQDFLNHIPKYFLKKAK